MSKHTSLLFTLLLAIISLGSMERANADSSVAQDPLMKSAQAIMRICYEDKNNFPFITKESISDSKTLGLHGSLTDLIIASAHTSNLSIQLVRPPWKRCIQHLAQASHYPLSACINLLYLAVLSCLYA
ncbi:hypothetical protein [Shewanella benthica]|nr:hypothetical protein [Shewanella benthica]